MTLRFVTLSLVCLGLALLSTGCKNVPGRPGSEPEVGRPEQLVSFRPLYEQNCAGCHGSEGKSGAAISLANPLYLAIAGKANIERITRDGVAGTMMPAFGHLAGGMLTDQQIAVLAQGMVEAWGRPNAVAGATAPPYQNASVGDPVQGQKAFTVFCARCHGTDAAGIATGKTRYTGSLVDPAYLALVSDQSLRSTILAGQPETGMPDWRSDLVGTEARPMTDQEMTDTVAWLASHRVAMPGQPYQK
ncbi:c-type cytochrome [Terriglobus saanensis]|uniref:Cytochrome c family protein n=1 Tax=Terriglobus saanensis (strain ATCC BAA-1853 / DSM 23119 / SP1PR4) TaxID=401053 RepID=E8V454_TERSS|nr:cytochrome c [Terriglobus saanensis]ADV82545.1 cytochrome c family protein [Terriglobus saanensis SP1PR4]